ncbi:carboxylate-amine ligase [Halovulum dunhuangense]|uniref:Putative glutamate--cysteine ligase 2 n=1 Tax=Halovulum dunhuangense TaxID=1505036 RepID=A0A849L5B7_9RHOB|nr:carboxylate-amine ligase [Halovulum dunhuangense]NNU81331.1 carboxylate-amine ligase [Halovulum dunhuangense]
MSDRPGLTLGIEEEYLIVDRETRELVREPAAGFMAACRREAGERVTNEYLQCQIEVGTRPHQRVSDAVGELALLRGAVAAAAAEHGYAAIAASTHPFSRWREQTHTRKDRYDALRDDLGLAVRRMMICGMHIHVGIEDEDLRIDLMNQAAYFLPHLLALSCSSPFWEGEDTGLSSYRLTVFDALPRTGLPDELASFAAWRRLVDHLVRAGCIEDATKIWWDIRPSDRFPTLEQRITDVCSRVEHVAGIAALYQALIAYLYRLKTRNQRWRVYPGTIVMENRWRAQRYGASGKLVDHGRSQLVPFADLVEEMIELFGADAEQLDCRQELLSLRRLVRDGTSADRQRQVHRAALEKGAGAQEAGVAVVDHLIAEFTAA